MAADVAAVAYGGSRHKGQEGVAAITGSIFFAWDATFEGTRCSERLACGDWGDEVWGGDDLEAGSGEELLIDQDDGTGRAGGVGDLRSAVGENCGAGGDRSGGHHGEAIGADGNVEVARVDAEAEIGVDRRDVGELRTGGDEINIDSGDAGGLVDEAESDLTGGSGLALILKGKLLQAGGYVSDEHGVLVGGDEGRLGRGENLFGSEGVGSGRVGPGIDGDVGCNGAEAEVAGDDGRILIDVEAGRVGRGVDDADLGHRGTVDDALAAGERSKNGGEGSETAGFACEMDE